METERILITENKKDEQFLRKKTADFDFDKHDKDDIRKLIQKMRIAMDSADGIGLSANQIGLDMNVFICDVNSKFYAIFNSEITKLSKATIDAEEGCLSIPGIFGDVNRPEQLVLRGLDRNGKRIKIKSWGILARVFQHETDHLNGKLFIDHIKK